MEKYDVAVVGGGPIGCYVAEQLASKGRQVAVFEEHHTIGEPVHCAGLVTQRVLDMTKCPKNEIVQNTIYGAIIHSPAGSLLTIGGEKVHALVIDRQRFDDHIAKNAQKAGATILRNHTVIAAKKQRSALTLDIRHDGQVTLVHSQLLIGADGAHSRIRDSFGFPQPIEKLHGISAELSEYQPESEICPHLRRKHHRPRFFRLGHPNQHTRHHRTYRTVHRKTQYTSPAALLYHPAATATATRNHRPKTIRRHNSLRSPEKNDS